MSTETLWVGGGEHVVFHLNPHVLSTGACPAWAGALGKLDSHAFKTSCFFMHNKTPFLCHCWIPSGMLYLGEGNKFTS